jgi:ABC-2 type transport system ATP-binding protein
MNNGHLAELSGVSKRFGKLIALDGVDLQVRSGELLAVLGPNGAGKTTAISLLLGLLQPTSGEVRLFGQPPQSVEPRRLVGVMMQDVLVAGELRVREHINLVSSYYPSPFKADEIMELTHTESLARRPYEELSSGQKRQAQFAMAICGRPQLLFLDEPTANLDVQARRMIWEMLRQLVARGSSIVLTTHYIEEAEALADRVIVLNKGHVIASGSVDEIRAIVIRKHISCITNVPPEQIETWSQVESVQTDRERLHITASNAETVVRRLFAADDNLQELEIRRAGLSDAFTELTQEATQ